MAYYKDMTSMQISKETNARFKKLGDEAKRCKQAYMDIALHWNQDIWLNELLDLFEAYPPEYMQADNE